MKSLILLLSLLSVESRAGAIEILKTVAKDKISGLQWTNLQPKTQVITLAGKPVTIVFLEGVYTPKNRSLFLEGKKVAVKSDGKFVAESALSLSHPILLLQAKGANGFAEKEELHFKTDETKEASVDTSVHSKVSASAGIGFTSLSHTESGVSDYSSTALTAKANFNYLLFPPHWDVSVSGYITALQFSKTQNIAVHYLGLNGRIGYIIPAIQEPWRVSLYGGIYYTTMFVEGNAFGFKNLAGPQLYPSVRRSFENGTTLSAYVKYSPIASRLSLLSLGNRELAVGLAYSYPLSNGHPLLASFDYSHIHLLLQNVTIRTSTVTLGVGYGL